MKRTKALECTELEPKLCRTVATYSVLVYERLYFDCIIHDKVFWYRNVCTLIVLYTTKIGEMQKGGETSCVKF